ncbi:MAG TPA: 3-oxoacyl-ACP reductase family protein [Chloroflexota bacterium]|nr:3-oxoacyl-ACP reductase family protein [Chloroflexota bacterium]
MASQPIASFDLTGRNAVITGGSRGIGAAIARGFAQAGARVVVAARNPEGLAAVAVEISQAGGIAVPVVADVTRSADLVRLATEAENALGPIDILVTNAGGSPIYRRAEQVSDEEWDDILALNLRSAFVASREVGRGMLERRSGRIINVISIGARVGLAKLAPYNAAKAGLEALTRTLAIEWAERGVLVNAIAPGFVETDLTEGVRGNERIRAQLLAQTPLARFAQPDEVVGAAIFLASPAAQYVTGQTIYVDGGWTAQ